VTADGSRIVTGSEDNTARLWDGRSGAEIAVLKGHTGAVIGVAVDDLLRRDPAAAKQIDAAWAEAYLGRGMKRLEDGKDQPRPSSTWQGRAMPRRTTFKTQELPASGAEPGLSSWVSRLETKAATPSPTRWRLSTGRVWPWRVASGLPARSHSRAVLSAEAVRMRPPSGENTALLTPSVWPWRVASVLPSRIRVRAGVWPNVHSNRSPHVVGCRRYDLCAPGTVARFNRRRLRSERSDGGSALQSIRGWFLSAQLRSGLFALINSAR
jgi:hypothetical protein